MRHLNIEYRPIASLAPRSRNPRTHTPKQIRQIGTSIREFGFTNPILIDRENIVVAGHGRIEAAKILGLTEVPTIRLEDLSPAQIRAYVIADNRLAELAGWDKDILVLEFEELSALDLDFDVDITGFSGAEIDAMIADAEGTDPAADAIPGSAPDAPVVTRPGDLWILGRHRVLCADATKSESYATLLDGHKADMVFTDPPYNVPVDGHVCGLGRIKHVEFAMASGEMSEAAFTSFLETVFHNLAAFSVDGSIHFACIDWRHLHEMLSAGRVAYAELKNLCVWTKTNGGMGSLYRSQHELVCVFKNGTGPHVNNVELGKNGRYRTNVWSYAGVNSFGAEREALALHPTVKPVALVADAILDCSKRGALVLDPFGGSGSTLIAAERTGRRGALIELEPRFVDTIIRRFETYTGDLARHAATGLSFAETAATRAENPEIDGDDDDAWLR